MGNGISTTDVPVRRLTSLKKKISRCVFIILIYSLCGVQRIYEKGLNMTQRRLIMNGLEKNGRKFLFKEQRRNKISVGLKEFNQTVLGREIKKRSLQKRRETMKAKKYVIQQSITRKTCALCKEDLSITKFNKKSASTDGFQPYCKTCFSAYCKKLKNKL